MKSVMEPEDNHLAKRICSGTCFGTKQDSGFEDVTVKRENDVNNADDEIGPAANLRSQNQTLPPMPFNFGRRQIMVQSPPHQILTPPVHQSEEQQGHSPMNGQHLMSMATMQQSHPQNMDTTMDHHGPTGGDVASTIKQNNTLMYPNPPSTPRPRDTPTISNSSNLSVSASAHYKIDQYHSYMQQMGPTEPGLMEDMAWLKQSLRQEPLDLRPNCRGEIGEVQDWTTLAPHHGVISSGKRAHHAEYMHQHGHQDLGPLSTQNLGFSKPLSVGSNNFISPISSSGRSLNTTGIGNCDDIMNDDLLTGISVRDLNKRLHGFPREEVIWFKQKLRQYVQNYRKWIHQKHELEMTSRTLQSEVHRLQMELNRVKQERDYFKRRYELLHGTGGTEPDSAHSSGQSNPSSEGLQYWRQRRDIWSAMCTTAIVKTGTSRLQFNGVSNS